MLGLSLQPTNSDECLQKSASTRRKDIPINGWEICTCCPSKVSIQGDRIRNDDAGVHLCWNFCCSWSISFLFNSIHFYLNQYVGNVSGPFSNTSIMTRPTILLTFTLWVGTLRVTQPSQLVHFIYLWQGRCGSGFVAINLAEKYSIWTKSPFQLQKVHKNKNAYTDSYWLFTWRNHRLPRPTQRLSQMCSTVGGEKANRWRGGARRRRSSECHCTSMVLWRFGGWWCLLRSSICLF